MKKLLKLKQLLQYNEIYLLTKTFDLKYYSLKKAELNGLEGVSKLPKSLKVLLENLLRYEDEISVNQKQIEAVLKLLMFAELNFTEKNKLELLKEGYLLKIDMV